MTPHKPTISYEHFSALDLRIGKIVAAERLADTDRLLKLSVDMGDETHTDGLCTIVSGIAAYVPDPAMLVGKRCAFVANLEPRMLRGVESQGMLLAVSGEHFSFLVPEIDVPPGSPVS